MGNLFSIDDATQDVAYPPGQGPNDVPQVVPHPPHQEDASPSDDVSSDADSVDSSGMTRAECAEYIAKYYDKRKAAYIIYDVTSAAEFDPEENRRRQQEAHLTLMRIHD